MAPTTEEKEDDRGSMAATAAPEVPAAVEGTNQQPKTRPNRRGKRKTHLDLATKLEVIDQLDNKTMTADMVEEQYGVKKRTQRDFMKNKEKLRTQHEELESMGRPTKVRCVRDAPQAELEEQLLGELYARKASTSSMPEEQEEPAALPAVEPGSLSEKDRAKLEKLDAKRDELHEEEATLRAQHVEAQKAAPEYTARIDALLEELQEARASLAPLVNQVRSAEARTQALQVELSKVDVQRAKFHRKAAPPAAAPTL